MRAFELTELFDRLYSYEWETRDPDMWEGRFSTDNHDEVKVTAVKNIGDKWGVMFGRNGSMRMTGEGDAMRIFATVAKMLEEFVDRQKPTVIFFNFIESRLKLYKSLVSRLAKKYNYKLEIDDNGPSSSMIMILRGNDVGDIQ